jgi:hypothetical protein
MAFWVISLGNLNFNIIALRYFNNLHLCAYINKCEFAIRNAMNHKSLLDN